MKKSFAIFALCLLIILMVSSCSTTGSTLASTTTGELVTESTVASAAAQETSVNSSSALSTQIESTPTVVSPYPANPAPVVPAVSAPISVENVKQLTRLTSLGEGEILSTQVSTDGKWIVFGTSNGVLILDSSSLEKVVFLPTVMVPKEVSFIDGGRKLTARDCDQGYVWSMPDGKEISHVVFFSQITGSPDMWNCRSIPDVNWENDFVLSLDSQKTGLYDLANGNAIYTLDYDDAQYAVFSSDNQYVVLYTPEKLVVVRNSDGKIIQELDEPGIKWLFFYPDGKTLAAVFENKTKFWNFSDFQLLDTTSGTGTGFMYTLPFFSPDGSVLVFRNGDIFRLLRAQDRQYINSVTGYGLKFLPDSRGFYIDSGTNQINYYELNDDRTKIIYTNSYFGSGFIADRSYCTNATVPGVFSADNTKLLLAKTTGESFSDFLTEILIYDLADKSLTHIKIDFQYTSLISAFWLQDLHTFGLIIESNGFQGFYILEQNSIQLTKVIGGRDWDYPFIGIGFSPSSESLIFTHGNRFISWDLKNNGYEYFPKIENEQAHLSIDTRIRFSPDEKSLFISDSSDLTYVFDAQNYSSLGTENYSLFYLTEGYTGIIDGYKMTIHNDQTNTDVNSFMVRNQNYDFDPIHKLLATVSSEEGLTVWDLSDFYNIKLIYSHQISILDTNGLPWYGDLVEFSPDGKFVAAASYTKGGYATVTVWDAKEGTQIVEFGPVYRASYVFSPDSKMLAVSKSTPGGNDISIFDLATGECLFTTGGYFSEGVEPRVAFSPDGKYLAILPEQGFPQLWGIP